MSTRDSKRPAVYRLASWPVHGLQRYGFPGLVLDGRCRLRPCVAVPSGLRLPGL